MGGAIALPGKPQKTFTLATLEDLIDFRRELLKRDMRELERRKVAAMCRERGDFDLLFPLGLTDD